MGRRIVVCQSGENGFQQRVKEIYDDYDEFLHFNKLYNIHTRLNFPSPKKLWEENPIIEGSTNPSDLRIVEHKKQKQC